MPSPELQCPHRASHSGDAVARIHVDGLTGDAAGQIAEQEGSGTTHFHLGDGAAQGSLLLHVVDHVENAADGGAGQGADRAGADGVDAHLLFGAQLCRQIANGRLQSSLGDAHHVVVGDRPLSTEVRERDHAGLLAEQRLGMGAEGRQGISADVEGTGKTLSGGGAVVTDQLFLAGKGQAVHQTVENAPLLLDLAEDLSHLVGILHIQRQEQAGLQGSGEFAHLGLKAALVVRQVSDAEFSTGRLQLLSDAPGDRTVVGDAGDENLLAGEIKQHRDRPERVEFARFSPIPRQDHRSFADKGRCPALRHPRSTATCRGNSRPAMPSTPCWRKSSQGRKGSSARSAVGVKQPKTNCGALTRGATPKVAITSRVRSPGCLPTSVTAC